MVNYSGLQQLVNKLSLLNCVPACARVSVELGSTLDLIIGNVMSILILNCSELSARSC